MTEDRYEIIGKIGQGGVGAVYKAYDTQLRREVAIKRVLADQDDPYNETATQNLLKEATALSSVQHPHICTVYDAGIDEEGPFVVMELINGKTLDQMVDKGTLTYEDFREVAIQSQEAMIAAQDLNIVHRDLKPSNVMVSWLPSGRFQVKLVDFGLAKFSAKPSLQTIDHGDAVFGSIFFMAPEQFERKALDQRTDMYSLGAMFYYTLTGNYPFDGESAPQVMASHLQGTVAPLQQIRPDLPVWLCEWVMWHIQREMTHRPNSARDALNKFLSDESLAAQGGLGATQQLITPAAPGTQTAPVFIIPNTGPQTVQPNSATTPVATPITGQQVQHPGLTPKTAPQPILTPDGVPSSHTSALRLQAPVNHNVHTSPPPPPAPAPAPLPQTASTPVSPPPLTPAAAPTLITANTPALATAQPQAPTSGTLGTTAPAIAPAQAATANQPTSQQLSPEEEAQYLANQKKPMNKTNLIVILSMLSVAIVIASIVLILRDSSNKENETYNRLIENIQSKEQLPVTKEELNVLLNSLIGTSNVDNRTGAYIALTKVKSADESFSAPLIMTRFATDEAANLNGEARKKLFRAISLNKPYHLESFNMMLDYAVSLPDSAPAEQAVSQLKQVASDNHFDSLLKIHDTTKTLDTKTKSVNAMIATIEQSTNKSTLSKKLSTSYKASNSDIEKLSYIRIMGATGTDESLAILTEALQSGKPIHVQSATRGLSNWPNLKPFPALVEAYAQSDTTSGRIRENIMKFFATNESASTAEKIDMWKQLITAAPDNRETRQLVGWISNEQTEVSNSILKHVITIPNFDQKSKEHAQKTLDKRDL